MHYQRCLGLLVKVGDSGFSKALMEVNTKNRVTQGGKKEVTRD